MLLLPKPHYASQSSSQAWKSRTLLETSSYLNSSDSFLRTKIQIAEWEKLETLNKRRMELESRILSTMRSMERHTMNICSELSAMFEGRIEEIRGSLSAER